MHRWKVAKLLGAGAFGLVAELNRLGSHERAVVKVMQEGMDEFTDASIRSDVLFSIAIHAMGEALARSKRLPIIKLFIRVSRSGIGGGFASLSPRPSTVNSDRRTLLPVSGAD